MANTYTQLFVHIIFTVKGRYNLINKSYQDILYKYIAGIIQNKNNKVIAINGMPDHIHILIGLNPDIPLSGLVRDIKHFSTNFINEKKWFKGKFYWQEGYGAFSYSRSQLDRVINYINNQEIHHKKRTFKEEYIEFLNAFGVKYDEKYIFE